MSTLPNGLVDMPFREYLRHEGISSSQLRQAGRSPEHYLEARKPSSGELETPSLRMGRALHSMVLTPELFEREFYEFSLDSRRGKAWQEELERAGGRTALTTSETQAAFDMDRAIERNPSALRLTANADWREITYTWTRDGRECRARADAITDLGDGQVILADLKTARSAIGERGPGGERGFNAACLDYGYHVQMEWYAQGWEAATDMRVATLVLVVVENTPPHIVRVYELSQEWRTLAAATIEECWANIVKAHSDPLIDAKPIHPLHLPSWAKGPRS